MGRGVLIVLEGIDGSGKTTQANLLAAALKGRGYGVLLTREPSDGPRGQEVRRYLQGVSRRLSPEEELNLFLADRREHVQTTVRPALDRGVVVISDRSYYSSVAYQGALGLDPERIRSLNEEVAVKPDLVLLLRLSPAEALARRRQGPGSARQVTETKDYLEKVAAIYDSLTGHKVHHLEAASSPEEVHALLLGVVLRTLEQG